MDNPTVAYEASTSGVTFGYASAAYPASARVTYTYWDPSTNTESLQAPYAQVDAPTGFGLPDILYRLPPPGTTYGEPGIKVYYAVRPSALSDYWTPWTLRETETTPQTSDAMGRYQEIALSALQRVRLKHASGEVDWEHDSIVFTVRSADVDVLRLPLPSLSGPPDVLVGKDPISGLPAFCPPPVIPPPIALPPVPPAAPSDICVQVRCGVAINCVGHLMSLYANWANWINGGLSLLAGAITAAALAILLDPLMIELDIALWAFLRPSLVTLSTTVISAGMGAMTSDKQTTLTQALFCQLGCTGDVCKLDAGVMVAWSNALSSGGWTGFDQLESVVLNQLILKTPMTDWQSAAATAGQSGSCDAWTCP